MRRLLILTPLLLCAPLARAATPAIVQTVSGNYTGSGPAGGIISMQIPLMNGTQAGNAIVVGFQTGSRNGITSVTCSDDKSDTYANSETGAGSDDGTAIVNICFALNVSAGARVITITFTGSTGAASWNTSAKAVEVMNIATSAALDKHGVNSQTATTCTTAAFTTTVANDFIFQYATVEGNGVTWTAGTSPWVLLGAEDINGDAAQSQVQTAAGAITPSITISSSLKCNSAAVALKSASSGSGNPAGIRVICFAHNNVPASFGNSITQQFPCPGSNAMAIVWIPVPGHTITCTSTAGTFSTGWAQAASVDSGTINMQICYVCGITGSATANVVITAAGSDSAGGTAFGFYGFSGAATSCFDVAATASGNNTTTTTTNTVSITPGAANEAVIWGMDVISNTAQGLTSPTGALFDAIQTNPIIGISPLDENGGYGHFYNLDTSAETWTEISNAEHGQWVAAAAAFKAAAGPPPPPDFSLTPEPPTSNTVTAGQQTMYTIAVTDINGFTGTVGVTCAVASLVQTSLPPTCSLNPTSITPGGQQTTTLSVFTTSRSFAPPLPFTRVWARFIPVVTLVALFLLVAAFARFALPRRQYLFAGSTFAAAVLFLVLAAAGCGGGGAGTTKAGSPGTPPGTYTVTVTGTSGPLMHSTSVTLVVN